MKRSTDRILTTHTGSLPRPDDLVQMLYAHEKGEARDQAAFTTRVREATAEVIRKQVEVGVDIVNDGEVRIRSVLRFITGSSIFYNVLSG